MSDGVVMGPTRAILFDFGGTLYDYKCLARGEAEGLAELARTAGIEAGPEALQRAHREGMRRVFRDYLRRPFYRHRELFSDAIRAMAAELGAEIADELLERHFRRQWERHRRDFELRPGVTETLRELRRKGLHLGIISNIDDDQLEHLGELAGLKEHFHSILSSETARSCKPDPRIFEEALRRADCAPGEALLVGDSIDADVAGASRVGLRVALLWHRDDLPVPDRGPRPDHVIRSIPEILSLVE